MRNDDKRVNKTKISISFILIFVAIFHKLLPLGFIDLNKLISWLNKYISLDSGAVLISILVLLIWLPEIIAPLKSFKAYLKGLESLLIIKITISSIAIIIIAIRIFIPSLKIDTITIGLMIFFILPWLTNLIDTAKFPGGWEIKFKDMESALNKVTKDINFDSDDQESKATLLQIHDLDANLALVSLRIEIEKRLRDLAELNSITNIRGLTPLLGELRKKQIIDGEQYSGLRELIHAGNQAAHGAKVDERVAEWSLTYGVNVLSVLDDKLKT